MVRFLLLAAVLFSSTKLRAVVESFRIPHYVHQVESSLSRSPSWSVGQSRGRHPAFVASTPIVGQLQPYRTASSSFTLRSSASDTEQTTTTGSAPPNWMDQVNSALSNVIDPDLNADIVTLKFVKNLTLDESTSTLSFDLELTTPACPVKDQFVSQCHELVTALPFIGDARITLTAQETRGETAEFGLTRVTSIIAVSSCKGGVGKSTTAVNLAYALKDAGARVGIFDADVYGPSLPTMIEPSDDAVRFVGRQICPLERDGVKLMSFGYVNDGAAVMRGPMVSQLLDQFLSVVNWGELDYLVLDMPPGTGDIQLTLSQRLNITAAVIVTTPQELSFADVVRGIDMFDSVNVPCVAVVENMAYYEVEKGGDGTGAAKVPTSALDMDQLRLAFVEKLQLLNVNGDRDATEQLASELVKVVQQQEEKSTCPATDDGTSTETEKVRVFGPGHMNRLSNQYGIEHTFSVPLLDKIAQSGDSGVPYVSDNADTPQAKIYRDLASAVVSEVAKARFSKGGKSSRISLEFDEERHVLKVTDGAGGDEDSDGAVEELPAAELRRECRCAACVEEMTGRQILNKAAISDLVRPTKIDPCGNYALSVNWSDGHRSLYPYRQIRSILRGEDGGSRTPST